MMKFPAAVTRIVTAGMLLALVGTVAAQQAYPSKPIRFIVPYAPGGSVSVVGRLVGQRLSENWNQQVIVDNRPGGNTIIGSEALVRSTPDGYTILVVATTHVVNQSLFPTPYDAIRDFAAVATVCSGAHILVINNSVPARNLQELISLLKSQSGKFNYSSSGSGATNHIAGEFFKIMTGVSMQHIPYKGGGPAITDLIGGQVQLSFQAAANAIPLIKSARIRAVASTGNARLSALPDLPTFAEAGLQGFDTTFWYGVLAPAGTPRTVINKLSTEIARIVMAPEVQKEISNQGMDPFVSTPVQFDALMKADLAKYAKVIKAANIKIEN